MIKNTDNDDTISIIARALLALHDCAESPDDDPDMLDTLTALRAHLTDDDFAAICNATEICPMHICDAAICADDDIDECADIR